jgi:hypothetical protein
LFCIIWILSRLFEFFSKTERKNGKKKEKYLMMKKVGFETFLKSFRILISIVFVNI